MPTRRQPDSATRSRPPRGRRRGRRIAAILATFSAVLLLAAAPATPATAKTSQWTAAHARPATHGHAASVAANARRASKELRRGLSLPRPTLITPTAQRAAKNGHRATSTDPSSATNAPRPQIVGPAPMGVAARIAGFTEAAAGNVYPPDPWVAVNSAQVVQVVNSMVRVTDRRGGTIEEIPTWVLFGVEPDQSPSDSRIIWDATHSRWVGEVISFNADESDNFLYLAISDGADATAGWTVWVLSYGDELPDYPSISSSSDKVVIADNLFVFAGVPTFEGADILAFTWASILAGSGVTINECVASGFVHPRAAQVLSSAADVHLIMEDTNTNDQIYFRLIGDGSCETGFADETDLTDLGIATFQFPPDPRQKTGDTIGTANGAVDERPTDAVWQSGNLYWVSTFPISYDGGTSFNDSVVVWNATTPSSGSPTVGAPIQISRGDAWDDFMGGVGLTRGGVPVISYSESSPATFVWFRANQAPGGVLQTPVNLDKGEALAAQERWGDFAGVATDPVGTGSVWVTHEVPDATGAWRTSVAHLGIDATVPTTPGTPTASIRTGSSIATTAPVTLTWSASTDAQTNVDRYSVTQSVDGGPFVQASTVTTPTIGLSLLYGHTYQESITAIDAVGNRSAARTISFAGASITQQTAATTTGTWTTASSTAFSGGSAKYASVAGASASFTASSARAIGIVVTRATTRGSFKVYVDGVLKTTVSSYGSPTAYRQILYQVSFATPGTHTVKIVVSGTSGHPRVDLDAFVVLR